MDALPTLHPTPLSDTLPAPHGRAYAPAAPARPRRPRQTPRPPAGPDAAVVPAPLALALWPHENQPLRAALAAAGVELSLAPTRQIFLAAYVSLRPELLLIDPDMTDGDLDLSCGARRPLIVLSSSARGSCEEPLPTWVRSALARVIRHTLSGAALR